MLQLLGFMMEKLFSGKSVGRNSAASLEHLEQSFSAKLLFDCRVSGNAAAVLQARNMFFHIFFYFAVFGWKDNLGE